MPGTASRTSDPHQDGVDDAARAAGDRPDRDSPDEAKRDRDDADGQADPTAPEYAAELVVALLVGAEEMSERRRLAEVRQVALGGAVRGDQRGQNGGHDEDRNQAEPEDGRAVAQEAAQRVAPQSAAYPPRIARIDREPGSAHEPYLMRGLRNA
jgi:hypothetical protein